MFSNNPAATCTDGGPPLNCLSTMLAVDQSIPNSENVVRTRIVVRPCVPHLRWLAYRPQSQNDSSRCDHGRRSVCLLRGSPVSDHRLSSANGTRLDGLGES